MMRIINDHPTRDEIQATALEAIAAAYRAGHQAPILVGATGLGKTHCAARLIATRVAAGERVAFVAHLDSLLASTARRLAAQGLDYGWVQSGVRPWPEAPVQLISTATAGRRLDRLPPVDLLIFDECHRNLDANLRIREALGLPPALGLTATPARLDGRSLRSGGFDHLVVTPDSCDLIEWGHLARLRTWTWPPPDALRQFRGRDLDSASLTGAILSGSALLGDALTHWSDHCRVGGRTRPTVAFCAGVAAAEATAVRWRAAGFSAMAIHGGSSPAERVRAERGLEDGSIQFVASADLWIAGVDVANIAAVVCLRTTYSLTNWLQMVGRGLRLSEEWDDCLLLDHAGGALRPGLGDPTQRRMHLWGLDDGQGRRLRDSCPPVTVCEVCRSTDMAGRRCRECGHERVLKWPATGAPVIPGQLMELDPRARIKNLQAEEKARRKFEERACWNRGDISASRVAFIDLATRRGYTNPAGWAAMQVQLRNGSRYPTRRKAATE